MNERDGRKRLVILGIDGMDHAVARELLPRLPNLRRLSESGEFSELRSVFPPDSIPAWITAYTGLDPSEHGILESVDYFAKGSDRLKLDPSAFRGKTFWDALSARGKEVCVINPFMAYPVWDVRGLMINGPVFISGEIQVSNPGYLAGLDAPRSLGGIVDFPTQRTLRKFCDRIFADTREQAAFGRAVLAAKRPDLFFQAFLTMDRLEHFLWRYYDRDDPTHPGATEFADAIPRFYALVDGEVGKFLDLLDEEDQLLVISDHGHGMRCTHCFNINECLRRRGDVVSRSGGNPLSPARVVEFGKNAFLGAMDRLGLQDHVRAIARLVPGARKLKKGKHLTDNSRNRAYVSDFTGTNPFGGICINRELAGDYENFREELIRDLGKIAYADKPAFLWIKKREEVYGGALVERFPDILFSLQPELGVNWGLHCRLFTRNPSHKMLSGGHREGGVLFMRRPGFLGDEPRAIGRLHGAVLSYFREEAGESE